MIGRDAHEALGPQATQATFGLDHGAANGGASHYTDVLFFFGTQVQLGVVQRHLGGDDGQLAEAGHAPHLLGTQVGTWVESFQLPGDLAGAIFQFW